MLLAKSCVTDQLKVWRNGERKDIVALNSMIFSVGVRVYVYLRIYALQNRNLCAWLLK